jgi:hypothetical protein
MLEDDKYVLPPDGLFDREGRYTGLPTETIYARLQEQQNQEQRTRQREVAASSNAPSNGGAAGGSSSNDSTRSPRQSGDPSAGQPAHPGGGVVSPARQWGEVRDLSNRNGLPLSPTERHQSGHNLDVRVRQAAAAAKRGICYPAGLSRYDRIASS